MNHDIPSSEDLGTGSAGHASPYDCRPHDALSAGRSPAHRKLVWTDDVDEVGTTTHLTLLEVVGRWDDTDRPEDERPARSATPLRDADQLGVSADRLWVALADSAHGPESAAQEARHCDGIPRERVVRVARLRRWSSAEDGRQFAPDAAGYVDLTGRPCPAEDPGRCLPGLCGNGRFSEIWSTVPGLGPVVELDRVLAFRDGCSSVYETPRLAAIVEALVGYSPYTMDEIDDDPDLTRWLRILTDHLRTSVLLLGSADIHPGEPGAGQLLRRIVRRSVRYADHLGMTPAEWCQAAPVVIRAYRSTYPWLVDHQDRVLDRLRREQEEFTATIEAGTALLAHELHLLRRNGGDTLSGETAFTLYDTYGFPIEFTAEIAAETGYAVDVAEYERRIAS